MPSSADLLLERVRSATQDEYAIEGELGRGGMAAVYLARDIGLDRRVAIKVMLPDLLGVEGIEDRFVIEARTSAKLDHPGIVTVYSVKSRDGLLCIVMKYLDGRTLEDVMKGGQGLDQAMVTTIVSQIAEALHYAHGEGIVHRDIKPSNIIIDTKGRPIVTDFGIAKITSGRSITVTGSMIGTPAYMSPEQCRGLPATTASDQYSLGVMMYEMLARRMPFDGTLFELIHAHSNESPPPLAELVPGIDPGLEATVVRMLAKNPRDRWESLSEVAKQLTQTKAHHRRSSEIKGQIAALARATPDESPVKRVVATVDLSGAQTEVQTTPAPQLVVTPAEPVIEIGQTQQLRVTEGSGKSLSGVRVTWKSEDPSVATVDEVGVVTGVAVGLAKITASGGAAFGRVAVTVRAATVDLLAITPRNPEIITDHELELKATLLDARGRTLVGQQVFWTSSDPRVCAVSQNGRAIGSSEGVATITATSGEVSASVQVRVKLPGVERVALEPGEFSLEAEESRRVEAVVYGPNDRRLAGRKVTWRSTSPVVATVDAEGNVAGLSPGTATIIALCEGKEGATSLTVRPQPVVAVRIQPARLQLEMGKSLQLQGVGEDRRGRPVAEKALEWHSADDSIAMIDSNGKVHAVRAGRTHIEAVVAGITSKIEVTVVPKPAAQLRIEKHPPSIAVGAFLSFDAQVLDADGAVIDGRAVTWTSSDTKVVSVDEHGSCLAKKPGSVRITAACENARASTTLSVAAAPVQAAGPAAGAAGGAAAAAPLFPIDPHEAATRKMPAMGLPAAKPAAAPPPVAPPPPRPSAPAPAPARPSAPAAAAQPVGAGAGGGTGEKKTNWLPIAGGVGVLGVAIIAFVVMNSGGGSAQGGTATPPTTAAPVESVPPPVNPPSNPVNPPAADPTKSGAPSSSPTARANTPANPPANNTGRAGTGGRAGDPPQTKQGTQPPVTNPPETKAPPPETKTTPPETKAPPPETKTQPPPVVTPPETKTQPPPVVTPPPANNPPPTSTASPSSAPACRDASLVTSMLNAQLSGDVTARLTAIYQPRDAADTRAKQNLLNTLRDANRLQVAVRPATSTPAADGCEWSVTLDFTYRNSFSQERKRSDPMRVAIETTGAAARVKHISGR